MEENRQEATSSRLLKEAVARARFMPVLMCVFAVIGLVAGFFWKGRYMWGMLIGALAGSLIGGIVDVLVARMKNAKEQIREAKAIQKAGKEEERK